MGTIPPYPLPPCTCRPEREKGLQIFHSVAVCNLLPPPPTRFPKRVALLLRNLGFQAVCLHGQMGQPKRLGALGKFKSGQRNVLIATDVASRGLDIPSVSEEHGSTFCLP